MATSQPNVNGKEDLKDHTPSERLSSLSLSSQTIHADDFLNKGQDVAPPLHVSTTFRYSNNPDALVPADEHDYSVPSDSHIYSRHTTPNTTRLEAILSSILHGPSLTYSSGLSAFHALLVYLNPKRISIGGGYHGCHGVIEIHQKLTGLQKLPLDCAAEDIQRGDIIHIETPLNPYGTAYDLAAFAEKAHSRGAYLTVDSTFGPPPLQDPFLWGADVVMHSGTKYIGGHSDMLCGILAVNPKRVEEGWFKGLTDERLHLGSVMGSMEGWLGIRSIRTLEIRVKQQSLATGKIVGWLAEALKSDAEDTEAVRKTVLKIEHASLQEEDIKDGWLTKQMPNGFGPVFALTMKEEKFARRLPSKLELFHHATSLGGVESLIEWRTMSDDTVDRKLLRVSIGIEGWEDLKEDFLKGFKALVAEQ
ncbi:cys met metabolism plp-dependent enzyme protein [Rutstroemia sp. NJR-2017a BVV2]|nr:cys met metabolism plp-dependent enzyme protein [Rutstroemia sp. NJR-2017a BVV2]